MALADLSFADRAVFLDGTLVLADLHLGKDTRSSVEFSLGERADLTDRLTALVERFAPEAVVFAGDVLHSFSTVPDDVPDSLAALERVVREGGARLVVTPGNHDTLLDSVWDGPADAEYRLDDGTVVCHGHATPELDAPRYVVGHDHPKITIEGDDWPCYLLGEGVYDGADVLVLPAFTRLASGVSVNGGYGRGTLERSPLVPDVDRFRPVVRDEASDETRRFPRLGELRRLL
ncbi:metallophosphoesterase [Halomarina oriensis]|uniref:Metallophosphoesterase n=1 Tax=Halomarina oriensis TaxID=671145 RepID=A0A6B0GNR0_9EURY|nr:metallophosphoesterase [Halomarina oriensis]